MPKKMGLPTYYKFVDKETGKQLIDKGTQLVAKGEYCGTTVSQKYSNDQHHFYEVDGEQRHVILNGGQLDWRARQGDLSIGGVYDVYYGGRETLKKGAFAGNESNQFDIETYSRQEIAELISNGAELRNEVEIQDEIEVAPVEAAPSNESLGDLA